MDGDLRSSSSEVSEDPVEEKWRIFLTIPFCKDIYDFLYYLFIFISIYK